MKIGKTLFIEDVVQSISRKIYSLGDLKRIRQFVNDIWPFFFTAQLLKTNSPLSKIDKNLIKDKKTSV